MNTDLLLLKSLETLAALGSSDCQPDTDIYGAKIPFGNIAFIKERFWKLSVNYIEPGEKRSSHPGLSISPDDNIIIFGSSQRDNRDPNDKNYFFVDKDECSILSKNMVFIFDTRIPATREMIDTTKGTYFEPLCEKKIKELKDAVNK